MKKIYLLIIITIYGGVCAFSQQTISGTVINAQTGSPLEGVSVTVTGTTSGTFTNASGQYSVSAPENTTIEFSLLDFVT